MREVCLTRDFPNYDAETWFGMVYVEPACLRKFHATVNRDPGADVPAWDAGTRTRELVFLKPVEAPAFVRRLLGSDTLRVVEAQAVTRLEPGSAGSDGGISLTSTPRPEMAMAASYSTGVDICIRPDASGGGCQVEGTVRCSAAGPFGLAGSIEGFMADTARASLEDFFEFCTEFLAAADEAALAAARAAACLLLAPVASGAGVVAGAAAVRGPPSPPSLRYEESEVWADAGAGLPASTDPAAVPLLLRYLACSSDQALAVLQSIDARLAASGGVVGIKPTSRSSLPVPALLGLGFACGAATAAALILALQRRGSWTV